MEQRLQLSVFRDEIKVPSQSLRCLSHDWPLAEWTQSIYRSYNREHPYVDDDDRNKDETPGQRVLRSGS